MTDPIADLIGDYRAFTALQRDRLAARGIDIAPYELSHLAVRVPEWDQYVHLRTLLERHAFANSENVWNGRPISMILLAEPLRVLDGQVVPLIELIPPVHQRVYKMGLEHLGVVVGEEVDAFSRRHRAAADRPAVPERGERAALRPVRGLHPREVPPPLAAGGDRAEGPDVRWRPPRRRLGPASGCDRPKPLPR
jgi:predicted metalloenzyme YecM